MFPDRTTRSRTGHSSVVLLLAIVVLVPYVLALLLLSTWWLAWHFTSSPSALTFGRPSGSLVRNVFAAAALAPVALLAMVVIPNLVDAINGSRLFRSTTANIAFRWCAALAVLMLVGSGALAMVLADGWWYGLFPLAIAALMAPLALRKYPG